MAVLLQPILVGDRRRSARAWLIFCDGSLRGILSRGDDEEVVLAMACDRRIQSADLMRFGGLEEARAWVSRRLAGRRSARCPPRAWFGATSVETALWKQRDA